MKNLMIIMLLATITLGCSKEGETTNAVVVDTGVDITVQNALGEDLLDPENPNSYQKNEIKLFYKIDGEIVEVYNGRMTYTRNFFIFYHTMDEVYKIRIFLNADEAEEKPITYIQWNETDRDTITATYRYFGKRSVTMNKVWYNGELKEPFFKIIKK